MIKREEKKEKKKRPSYRHHAMNHYLCDSKNEKNRPQAIAQVVRDIDIKESA